MTHPSITRTTHTLPFDKLSPRDFERLCLWLVEREGYERTEHLGAAGSEQGRDIVAWREGALWAFQCKRVRSFGPKDALAEVEKVLALPEAKRPAGLVFLVTCDVSANTRQQARERCAGEIECHFWVGTELDEKVKRRPDIVREFFGAVVIYDEGTKPVSIGDLLDACQAQVKSVLYDVRHKYGPDLYVNRAIERELDDFFDTPLDGPAPNCFLLVAPAGSGKTNLLCELARVRVTRQPVLLLMGGNLYIGATTGLLGAIQAELEAVSSEVVFRSAGDSLHTLHRLAEELDRDALLFLDAINEHDRPVQMRKAVKDLLRKTRERRIKLVVTCRDYYWGLFKGRLWEGATVNDLPAEADEEDVADEFSHFAADEHERALPLYLDHYQITGRPIGDAAEQCRHPLLLRFFCEAYRGQDVGEVEDIRLKELFDRYWSQKLASIAERMIQQGDERLQDGLAADVGDYLLNVAAHMLHHNVRAIPLAEISQATGRKEQYDDPRSVYGRIRDEFIILEEKERGKGQRKIIQVVFVYEQFMEYVMARSLLRDWDRANLDEEAILAEIEALTNKYGSFAQIIGVMVYLALMLKGQHDLALWSLLLNRGERWQKVVFEAFRKLPKEQLDASVFDALEEMLVAGDDSVQQQALDTLKVKRVGQAAPASMVGVLSRLATHKQEPIARRAVLALGNIAAHVALPALFLTLSDTRESVKKNAITALKGLGDAVTSPLIVFLQNSDASVRRRAAEALGGLGDVRAVKPLITTLQDRDASVRRRAAEALGGLGDVQAVEHLVAALKDRDEYVRSSAAEALGRLGDKRAVESLVAALRDSNAPVRRRAAEALGALGDKRAAEPLVIALQDKDRDVRRCATQALGQVWQLPALTQLGSSSVVTRLRAAEALEKLGGRRAVGPLTAALKDSDQRVRSKAAEVLGKLGDARAIEPLIAALKDKDVRLGAIRGLGHFWQLPALIQLGDSDQTVRWRAAEALGKLGDPRVVEPLIAALKDSNRQVRSKAAEALAKLERAAVEPLIVALEDSDWRVWSKATETLGELGDARAVEPLIAALKDSNWNVRSRAAEALGELGDARAVKSLIAALKDSNWRVRSKAAKALGELGDRRAVEPLIATLKDMAGDVPSGAAEALGKLGDARAVEPLIVALKHKWWVHSGAAKALGELGDRRAVEPLIATLRDGRWDVRSEAAEALGELGDARAVKSLIAALKDSNWRVRSEAAKALGKLGEPAVEPLIAALKDSNWNVRSRAAEALGGLGEPAVEPLIAALKDSDLRVRSEAAKALGKLGEPAVEPLIAALKDRSSSVRLEVARALGTLRDARAVKPLIATQWQDTFYRGGGYPVRQAAADALRRIGTPEALAAVRKYEA